MGSIVFVNPKNSQDLFLKMKSFLNLFKKYLSDGTEWQKKMEKEFDEKIVILNYISTINSYSKM